MVQFIAEVSNNYSRDLQHCFSFIDRAAEIGCDAVKFELFRIEDLFAPEVLEVSEKHRSQKAWEFPVEFLPEIQRHCRQRGMLFGCTPFSIQAVNDIEPFVDFIKIESYEMMWDDLLIHCANTYLPLIVSTGMADLREVKHAVSVINSTENHSFSLLHCISPYPAQISECNLAAIKTLKDACGCRIGWSDHSADPEVVFRAATHWHANIIEFQLDMDSGFMGSGLKKQSKEYQSGHCWMPDNIKAVIHKTRHYQQNELVVSDNLPMDGDGWKQPTASEMHERLWRADPLDGLRPIRKIRQNIKQELQALT